MPVGVSGLLTSLAPNLGYMRQKENSCHFSHPEDLGGLSSSLFQSLPRFVLYTKPRFLLVIARRIGQSTSIPSSFILL